MYSYICHCKKVVLSTWRKQPALWSISEVAVSVLNPQINFILQTTKFSWKEEEEPRTKRLKTSVLYHLPAPLMRFASIWKLACLGEKFVVSLWTSNWLTLTYCLTGEAGRLDMHKMSNVAVCLTCSKWVQGGDRSEDITMVFWNSSEMSGLHFLPSGSQEIRPVLWLQRQLL